MLGPFGSGVLSVLIPQVREDFATTTGAVTAGITVYMVPFAVIQLVSGTLGERWGLGRTVRIAYLVYAAVSVLTVVAPDIGLFLVGRALQGAVNAFLSPLLLAALASTASPGRLGRLVGTFVAVQTAGVVLSPLVGGAAGAVDWRLAFIVPAVLAAGLAALPMGVGGDFFTASAEPPRLRSALTRRVASISAVGAVAYLGIGGVSFVVALLAADELDAGPTTTGIVVAGFGVTGILGGRLAGVVADRFGPGTATAVVSVVCAVALPVIGLAESLGGVAAAWAVAGVGATLVWAGLGSMAVQAAPGNRGGATSVYSAFRFVGLAVAPIVWLPLFHADERLPFVIAGALNLLVCPLALRLGAPLRPVTERT
jgi:MFS family permease